MNNHAHILIQTESIEELGKYMQRLNTKYGKYYNQKYNRVGYVFRNRYKSEGIYSEKHLYHCIRYIHNNPVKAGICSKPEEYPYSNYKRKNKQYTEETTNEYVFMDIEEDNKKTIQEVISHFLKDNKLDLSDLRNKEDKLRKLVTILKENLNLSFRKIAKILEINREKIRKIYYQ